MRYDVIVVGGSYAGMAASLQLLRARRHLLVIDAGLRRNRFARSSHGFLGRDGEDPGEIAATARRQLGAYPTLTWAEDTAATVAGARDRFVVSTADGATHHGRRILLATGVVDELPEIEGLAARWGRTVFHCPYCHGYELDRGAIGVIGTGPMSVHQAELLTEWGGVTLLTNGAVPLAPDARRTLERRGATIEDVPLVRLEGEADVRLADGRVLGFAGLFTASRVSPASPLALECGCALEETPMGLVVRTNDAKETSVPGIYACGDVAHVPHSVSLAVGDGAMAGVHLHRSLVWPEA